MKQEDQILKAYQEVADKMMDEAYTTTATEASTLTMDIFIDAYNRFTKKPPVPCKFFVASNMYTQFINWIRSSIPPASPESRIGLAGILILPDDGIAQSSVEIEYSDGTRRRLGFFLERQLVELVKEGEGP